MLACQTKAEPFLGSLKADIQDFVSVCTHAEQMKGMLRMQTKCICIPVLHEKWIPAFVTNEIPSERNSSNTSIILN